MNWAIVFVGACLLFTACADDVKTFDTPDIVDMIQNAQVRQLMSQVLFADLSSLYKKMGLSVESPFAAAYNNLFRDRLCDTNGNPVTPFLAK